MRRNISNEMVKELSDLVKGDEVTVWYRGIPQYVLDITKATKTQITLSNGSRWLMRGTRVGDGKYSHNTALPFVPSDLVMIERINLVNSIGYAFSSNKHGKLADESIEHLALKLLQGSTNPGAALKLLWEHRVGRISDKGAGVEIELLRELNEAFSANEAESAATTESAV